LVLVGLNFAFEPIVSTEMKLKSILIFLHCGLLVET